MGELELQMNAVIMFETQKNRNSGLEGVLFGISSIFVALPIFAILVVC